MENAAVVEKVRKMIVEAQARGMDWGAMRTNAHKSAASLGTDIADVITTPNLRVEGELERLTARAVEMRAEYSVFVDLWYADACEKDKATTVTRATAGDLFTA